MIKLFKTDPKSYHNSLIKNRESESKSPKKSTSRKPSTKNIKKLFYNLHDRKYLSALGKRQPVPELPKSLFPKCRLTTIKLKRPSTAALVRVNKSASRLTSASNNYSSSISKQKSLKNDYWDGYVNDQKRAKHFRSFDRRSVSANKNRREAM